MILEKEILEALFWPSIHINKTGILSYHINLKTGFKEIHISKKENILEIEYKFNDNYMKIYLEKKSGYFILNEHKTIPVNKKDKDLPRLLSFLHNVIVIGQVEGVFINEKIEDIRKKNNR